MALLRLERSNVGLPVQKHDVVITGNGMTDLIRSKTLIISGVGASDQTSGQADQNIASWALIWSDQTGSLGQIL